MDGEPDGILEKKWGSGTVHSIKYFFFSGAVRIIRIGVDWGLYWVPIFAATTISRTGISKPTPPN